MEIWGSERRRHARRFIGEGDGGAIGGGRQPSEAGRFTGVWVSVAALATLSFLQPTVWSSSKVQLAMTSGSGTHPRTSPESDYT